MARKRLLHNPKRVSFLVDADVWAKFERICIEENDLYPSQVLRHYVEQRVKFHEEKEQSKKN
jgi:hypothetical protein